ncbi:hypothetical protein KAS31_00775 [Candidatus Parcubacteria bacterium]|nr:hypothetical protein [Candidatus Parcubacteria bacterium]
MPKFQSSTKFLPFAKISRKDIQIVGGKGANLGEMTKAGIQIPDGFVVASLIFEDLIKNAKIGNEIKEIIKKIEISDSKSIEKASDNIKKLILRSKIVKDIEKNILDAFDELDSKYVAVRSSATAEDSETDSWAGQLDTFLNVSKEDLIENIKNCWISLFSERALFYRIERKMDEQNISLAVVVQKMIQSEVAGVCFTVHPVNKDKNQLIVEAGFGLGEAIVSGFITPDSYVIDKKDLKIIKKNILKQDKMIVRSKNGKGVLVISAQNNESQKLSNNDIIKLSKLCIKIEKYYKRPQDIEWALKDNKFYILQSRPITTL